MSRAFVSSWDRMSFAFLFLVPFLGFLAFAAAMERRMEAVEVGTFPARRSMLRS